MTAASPPPPLSGDKEAALANVALLYYGEGLTQGEIARRLKVSRATIVNMLREARERGVVEIRVEGRALAASSLGRELCARFGLSDAYVAQGAAEAAPRSARPAAPAAAGAGATGARRADAGSVDARAGEGGAGATGSGDAGSGGGGAADAPARSRGPGDRNHPDPAGQDSGHPNAGATASAAAGQPATGSGPPPAPDPALRHLARVAASALLDILEPGDRVGVEWGRTVHAVASALPRHPVAGVEVCQMVGSMVSAHLPAAETCAILIANALSARCFTLHAPAIASSAALAQAFLSEPTIRAQLDRLEHLDMVVSSIGTLSADTHLVAAGMASPAMIEVARAHGAIGILCCRYITAAGAPCHMPPDERQIGIHISALRRARKRLLIANGADRAEAVHAAIRGGLVSHLCVDQPLAEALLAT